MTKELNLSISAPDIDLGPAAMPPDLALGQWYWVLNKSEWSSDRDDEDKPLKKGQKYKWLGCVMSIGSNFVKLHSPHADGGYRSIRIHFNEFDARLEHAPEAETYIVERQKQYQAKVNGLLADIHAVTSKLGIVPSRMIEDDSEAKEGGSNQLVVVAAKPDTKKYKSELIVAKDETLPDLFKQVHDANKELARWMSAPILPMQASIGPMENSIGAIKERIYTIELYAGLTEEAVQCRKGKAADMHEKLHVMQRRAYMDEECLVNYSAGGMTFKDIGAFDKWLSRKENYERILPFPRTLVAFRVRREKKHREDDGNIRSIFINFQYEIDDKRTFLYIRNGEQIWRVDCDFEFDEMIIPNRDQFDPAEPMMVKTFAGRIDEMMPKKKYDYLAEIVEKHKAWVKEAEKKPENKKRSFVGHDSPYYDEISCFRLDSWEQFNQDSVYFDDVLKKVGEEIKRYNRIAVIVQGLFDRSEVLHPHPRVQMWVPESFDGAVKLVYDSVTLTFGDKPDFEAYRERLNASIDENSILVGQEDAWARREAVRENRRIANDYRFRGTPPNYTRFRPEDDGPAYIGQPTEWKARARKAVFRWTRKSRDWRRPSWDRPKEISSSIEVPAAELFNISAYKPGDYKQFFADPRTRREYIKWTPFLLAAEDYYAGKHRENSDAENERNRDY